MTVLPRRVEDDRLKIPRIKMFKSDVETMQGYIKFVDKSTLRLGSLDTDCLPSKLTDRRHPKSFRFDFTCTLCQPDGVFDLMLRS